MRPSGAPGVVDEGERRAVLAAAAHVRARWPLVPAVAVVAGSGLAGLSEALGESVRLAYADVPGWPEGTTTGHAGVLTLGRMGGLGMAVLGGRSHYYEGTAARATGFGVRVMACLGARMVVVTGVSGSLRDDLSPGSLLVVRDHLFLPGLAGAGPLVGPNDEAWGPRFPSLVGAYDPALRKLAMAAAADVGLEAREGVYAMVFGPHYETPAEARMLRLLGADAVGMSTCPEVVVARHAGLRVLGLCPIANRVPLDEGDEAPPDLHQEVVAEGRRQARQVGEVVRRVVLQALA